MRLHTLLYSFFGCFTLLACDEIAPEDRIVYIEPTDVKRAVLIEDFTGQLCLNCPNAADQIEKLIEDYGEETIIPVGIHCGNLSMNDNGKFQGFKTSTGDYYMQKWGVSQQPIGLVNRTGGLLQYTEWATAVANETAKAPGAKMSGYLSLNKTDSIYNVSVSVDALQPINGTIQLWVVEDSIISVQQLPTNQLDLAYMHMHVFRMAINRVDGDPILLRKGEHVSVNWNCPIDPKWNLNNISVVAILADANGVQQVIKIKNN